MHFYFMLSFQKDNGLTSVSFQELSAKAARCSGPHLERWLAGGSSCV